MIRINSCVTQPKIFWHSGNSALFGLDAGMKNQKSPSMAFIPNPE
jgi:hypothetical protein